MKDTILEQLLIDRAAKRPVVLATVLEGGAQRLIYPSQAAADPLQSDAMAALRDDKSRVVETADGRVFLHAHNPPLRMFIVCAVHIAQPLARMAVLAGFDVHVADPRGAFAAPDRFPDVTVEARWPDEALIDFKCDSRTALVTLTHDPKVDDPALHIGLRSPVFYVGCLGSPRTHALRVERLSEAGFSSAEINRIHGPIGLDIGAKSPAEIALSIMAEVTQVLRTAPRAG